MAVFFVFQMFKLRSDVTPFSYDIYVVSLVRVMVSLTQLYPHAAAIELITTMIVRAGVERDITCMVCAGEMP
jgi:hypothetical protein